MMIYTFREEVVMYTTVIADSEEQAWAELDKVEVTIPECMTIDVMYCEIIDIKEIQ
jgi:hypothetical protein